MMQNKVAIFFMLLVNISSSSAFALNDGHIHYNSDVWADLSKEQALSLLTENGIDRAIVFSTPAAGTEKLYQLAPQRVIPFLMPYRVVRDRFTWHSDPGMVAYVKQQLSTGMYKGLGEFHLFKEHKSTRVVQQLMQLVADHKLMVSAHSDGETIEALINMQPQVTLIWAHCGMDHPVADVSRMLKQYPNLYCELSFRYNMFDDEDRLLPEWKQLLEQQSPRFLLGMDTYIPRRWASLPENTEHARQWLKQLSAPTAKLIGSDNISRLFPLKD